MMNTDKEQQSLFGKLDSVLVGVGNAVSWLIAVLIITISIQVVLRYLFKQSYTALEEIQWHFFCGYCDDRSGLFFCQRFPHPT